MQQKKISNLWLNCFSNKTKMSKYNLELIRLMDEKILKNNLFDFYFAYSFSLHSI